MGTTGESIQVLASPVEGAGTLRSIVEIIRSIMQVGLSPFPTELNTLKTAPSLKERKLSTASMATKRFRRNR